MLIRYLDRLAARLTQVPGVDFTKPPGEPALVAPGSISWRVFRNPVTMYIGGVAAVLLELGEPRVRHGVWDHSSFRRDPAARLRRTGMAAMMTVFGARSEFEALAARVRGMHARVRGETPDGQAYAADDPELLLWVQVTAGWAFLEAYRRYARPVDLAGRNAYYAESRAAAALYGVDEPPASEAEIEAIFARLLPLLEPSPIIRDFLGIMDAAPILPAVLRPVQGIVTRAAVDLLPPALRARIGLSSTLGRRERALLKGMARLAERIELPSGAHAQAKRRLAAAPRALKPPHCDGKETPVVA